MRPPRLLAALLLLAAAAPALRADTAPRRWYGQRMALIDGVLDGAIFVALVATGPDGIGEPLFFAGELGQVAVGPTVHLLHHRPGRALASGGLRAVGTAASLLFTFAAGYCTEQGAESGDCTRDGKLSAGEGLFVLSPILAVQAVDCLLLARERVETDGGGAGVSFTVSPVRAGAMVGLAGAF